MYKAVTNLSLGKKSNRLTLSDIAISIALVLALIPLIDNFYLFNELYFYLCCVGIFFCLVLSRPYYSKKELYTTLPIMMLFLTNPYIGFNEYVFIFAAFLVAVRFSSGFSRVSRIISAVLLISTLFNIFVGNIHLYPMSDKTVLLLWNPNVYWLIVVLYIVSGMRSGSVFPSIIEFSFLYIALAHGYSRLSIIIYLIAKMRFLFCRFHSVSRFTIVIFPFLIILIKQVYPSVFQAADILMSYRYRSHLNGIVRQSISDMPFLDLDLFASLVFVVFWIIIVRSTSDDKLFLLPAFFIIFLLDSTIYAPLVIFWFLNTFSIGYNGKTQKRKSWFSRFIHKIIRLNDSQRISTI